MRNDMEKGPIRAALVGAGERGMNCYAPYALTHPDEIQFVAVAEPDTTKRDLFSRKYEIPRDMQFVTWEDLLIRDRFCDALLICTQDSLHFQPAKQAVKKGYSILLEKPVSNKLDECIELTEYVGKENARVHVCHVLRHVPFFKQVKSIIDSGVLGTVISIQHNENVGFFHYAHSYVRGNWRNSTVSSPMILSKSCHDMDLLNWLTGSTCRSIASFGSLRYFTGKNAPVQVPGRCTDGCADENRCPFSAYHYLDPENPFRYIVYSGEDTMGLVKELKTGPYGRCVYRCDNNVVDHQVVIIDFEGGITSAFTMCAFSHETSRTLKIMCTHGEMRGHMERNEIELHDFLTGYVAKITVTHSDSLHSGGDEEIMRDFVRWVRQKDPGGLSVNTIQNAVNSHVMAFAAEESRLSGKTVQINEFYRKYLK